jgi:hypothetical protein
VGGQVSTGAELENANKNESFFNNVEVQYRLNEGASMYVRAFYNANTYDWLDGQIGEYGGGFTWRRKLSKFSDIFRWKTEKQQVPADSPMLRTRKDSVMLRTRKDSVIRNNEK